MKENIGKRFVINKNQPVIEGDCGTIIGVSEFSDDVYKVELDTPLIINGKNFYTCWMPRDLLDLTN